MGVQLVGGSAAGWRERGWLPPTLVGGLVRRLVSRIQSHGCINVRREHGCGSGQECAYSPSHALAGTVAMFVVRE